METPPACAGGLGGGQVGAMGGKKQLPGPRMGPGASLGCSPVQPRQSETPKSNAMVVIEPCHVTKNI